MIGRLASVFAVLALFTACAAPQRCSRPPDVVNALKSSYRVIVSCDGKPVGYGSAVAVSANRALTARHVTDLPADRCPNPSWKLVASDGTVMGATAGVMSDEADVAVLVPEKAFTRWALIRVEAVEMGEQLTLYTGHDVYSGALEQSFTLKRALAGGYWKDGKKSYLVVSGHIVSGNSGSGVFDAGGYLVGIISLADSASGDENEGLAVPAKSFP